MRIHFQRNETTKEKRKIKNIAKDPIVLHLLLSDSEKSFFYERLDAHINST